MVSSMACCGFSRPSLTSSSNNSVWWNTSAVKPKSGYSFLKILNACGSIVTIFFTSAFSNSAIFAVASSWNKNSFPRRRGVSPEFFSLFPRIANDTPASFSKCANDNAIFCERLSNAPIEPTQSKYSKVSSAFLSSLTVGIVRSGRASRQFSFSLRLSPHGFPWRSMFVIARCASGSILPSVITK